MTAPDDASRETPAFARLVLRIALALAGRIPSSFANAAAAAVASLEYRLRPARREAVHANLRAIARAGHPLLRRPADRERFARSVFRAYHRHLAEFLAQGRLTPGAWDARFRFEGTEHLYRAAAAGRGAVIAGSHLGNWELAGLALARLGFRVHVVTGTQWNPLLHGAVRELKERSGIAVSTPEDGFTPLIATLRRGGLVVLLVDGDVYRRGLTAPFFGRAVSFPAGPALLARRAGAPLLHAHAARDRGGHRIVFDGADLPDRALPLGRDLERLTARVAAAQERNIAAQVGEWCIFRPFFGDERAPADAA
ncbi:MAG TPA: lysophospholipid acyltransferase family protein [Candidatus Omnitrophota bacterium]|nr:lysophospholipid acyltransferase family protein [Candidatus Omnitrophota bacterium]